MHRIVELIGDEADANRPGRDPILDRLVEVLLVEALRFRSQSVAREEQGLLAGLSDPALAHTLREIHVDVTRRWTVEQLARAAGMSRAVFAERFSRKIGMPPTQYLLEWRVRSRKICFVASVRRWLRSRNESDINRRVRSVRPLHA